MNMDFKRKLPIPKDIKEMFPISEEYQAKRDACDKEIKAILDGSDDRLLMVIGPCSADNEESCVLRIPYVISDNDEVALDMSKKESVRQCWLTKADEEKLDAEKATMNELVAYKQARIEDDRRKEFALVLDEFKDLGEVDDYKEITKDVMAFENADALREKLYAVRGKYAKPMAKKPIAQIRIPVGFEAKKTNTELEEFMNKYLPNKK